MTLVLPIQYKELSVQHHRDQPVNSEKSASSQDRQIKSSLVNCKHWNKTVNLAGTENEKYHN